MMAAAASSKIGREFEMGISTAVALSAARPGPGRWAEAREGEAFFFNLELDLEAPTTRSNWPWLFRPQPLALIQWGMPVPGGASPGTESCAVLEVGSKAHGPSSSARAYMPVRTWFAS